MKLCVILVLVALGSPVFAQETDAPDSARPYPFGGWDSLALRIQYPELARRANIQGCANVHFAIDSAGAFMDSIHVDGCPLVFIEPIRKAIRSTRWCPAYFRGKPVNLGLSFPIHFVVKGEPYDYGFTVTTPCYIQEKSFR